MSDSGIFKAAIKLPADQRDIYLDQACGDNRALRQEVESLLQAHDAPGCLLEDLSAGRGIPDDYQPIAERPGTIIGPYKLLEQIGEGGFGIVYMAEQQHPVRRKVALKVIKPGMDTKQVVARFEAERQALALMDHSHLAKVLDAGTTDRGRPYFAMELIRGVPITEFCDASQLTPRERLELFVTVCQAVQHAHQRGIIHRDLKPNNVLVTLQDDGTPLVKVIDFGIAKALGPVRLTDKTLFTAFAQIIGTPLYMSPEQAEMNGQDTDTRTDIYALGVLLYELLTGTTPFDKERLKEASYDEIRRIIREEEPAKPSTRISTMGKAATTVSANRQSEPRRLSQLFRGELDWIVMKALDKDRNRRYETASSFAADVLRYLHDEPVLACPPSPLYRFRKFARRNKAALTTASAVAITLVLAVIGLAASTVLVLREKAQTDAAKEELERTLYFQRIALAERERSANNLARMEQLLGACRADLRGWEWDYLNRLLRGKALPPLRHDAAVLSAAISPDGQRIASADQRGFVKIWDAQTGRLLQDIHAYPGYQARCVAFSPDSRRLASACWGGTQTLTLWDVESGRRLHGWPGHRSANQVIFDPDGRLLVSAGGDKRQNNGEVRIWDATTYEERLAIQLRKREVRGLAVSPDGQRLATSFVEDPEVKVWDMRTGRELLTFPGHTGGVNGVAFSPDGRWIASGSQIFNRRDKGEVKVWDSQTGRERFTFHGQVVAISVAFSPDSRRLASGDGDGILKLWDLATGQEALTLREHGAGWVASVAFSPEGHRLVSAGHDGTVRVWDGRPWREGEPGQALFTLRGHTNGVTSVAFRPREQRLASGDSDGVVKLWEPGAGKELRTLRAHPEMVRAVAFSPDGKWLATAAMKDQTVKLWDAATGQHVRSLQGRTKNFLCLAFSPDGARLAAAGFAEFTIDVWNVKTGQLLQSLPGHDWAVPSVAFCGPDARYLASAGYDGTLRVWDLTRGQGNVRPRPAHEGPVFGVAFSADGRLLASGSFDRTVRVWAKEELGASWRAVHILSDTTGGVTSVAFSPDGRLLAWGATDSTVKIADLEASRRKGVSPPLVTLRGHTSRVNGVALSPDGRYVASASDDGTVKVWETPVTPGAMLSRPFPDSAPCPGWCQKGRVLVGHRDATFQAAEE
jgi:WD40 repeat protein/serine/threonine protein kinase